MTLQEAVYQALLLNELSGNRAAAYRFSDAGGKSGLSFGVSQFDVTHNADAVACLKEIGFTDAELAQVKNKAAGDLCHKLATPEARAIIDRYDMAQVKECLDHVMTVARARRFSYADDCAIVHAADYNNQFYMSTNGTMSMQLIGLQRPVTGADILKIKLRMPWGQKAPEDVERRYNNIQKLFGRPAWARP